MTRIKELKQHFEALEDMKEIVTALKTLAFMETKKLTRYLADQGRAVDSIKAAAGDFLSFYTLPPREEKPGKTLLVAVGADRGFCGNFNDQVVEAARTQLKATGAAGLKIIVVGDRLRSRFEHDAQLNAVICDTVSGATFAEEAPAVLAKVVDLVSAQLEKFNSGSLVGSASGSGAGSVSIKLLAHQWGREDVLLIDPLADLKENKTPYGSPPKLNLSPARFFRLLLDQYLQLVFYSVFYSSLMAENNKRIMHLDTALRRLEDDGDNLKRKYNQARQEEITEEIEILIMNCRKYAGML
jgi:F-type H+-transporting ATPase subunit gamma